MTMSVRLFCQVPRFNIRDVVRLDNSIYIGLHVDLNSAYPGAPPGQIGDIE